MMRTERVKETGLRKVFLVGAPRCGTTSVAAWLANHPQVCFCKLKEPWYLNSDFGPRKIINERQYGRLFRCNGRLHRLVAEASTTYLYSEAARHAIAAMGRSSVLIMVRDPVDMFRSWHWLKVKARDEDIEDPVAAWQLIKKRKNGDAVPSGCKEPRWLYYDDMCALGSLAETWLLELGQERVHVLFLDDLKDDPYTFFDRLASILKLDVVPPRGGIVHLNRTTTCKSTLVENIIRYAGRVKRAVLPVHVSFGILDRLDKWNSRPPDREASNKELPKPFEKELRDFFTPEIEKLERCTGRDLTDWKIGT